MPIRLGSMSETLEALNGTPTTQQNISVSTTSARQSTALSGGRIIMLVNDGATKCYFKVGDSTVVATTSDGVPLTEDEKIILILRSTDTHVAFITASSTTTARLYELV